MGNLYETINDDIRRWLTKQHMFFVATAPRDGGSINLSPKGQDTLRLLDERTLAFVDFGGSGIETIAHLRENGRIVIMFCAFEGPPKIFRFHGRGTVVTPLDPLFDQLVDLFDRKLLGIRSIIRVDVERISDSCGFGVPLYEFRGQRSSAADYLRANDAEKIRSYLQKENSRSLDGLPGLSQAEAAAFRIPKG